MKLKERFYKGLESFGIYGQQFENNSIWNSIETVSCRLYRWAETNGKITLAPSTFPTLPYKNNLKTL